jgi:hypothetical protein
MSSLLVQFNNPNNWSPFYDRTFTVTPIGNGARYVPIPSQTLPIALDERIIAVKGTSTEALTTWQTAGWLTPLFDLSSTPLLEARWKRYRIPLRSAGLCVLPDFDLTYQLRLDIPKWLKQARIEIWSYIGPIDDSTEKLIRELSLSGGGGPPNAVQGPTIITPGSVVDGGTI